MSMLDWFARLYEKRQTHCLFAAIAADHLDPASAVETVQITAEKHYFRVWLAEMFLQDDRRLFREFVPVVHSVIRLQFAGNAAQELPYVAGPQNVGLGTTLGRGVQLNHALTNLLPFRGGLVSIAAGLFAYKQKDFFQGFMEILHDVSGLFNVGQLSQTLGVVDKAIDGIQNLMGAGDKDVHLIYFEGFGGTTALGGSALKSGYRVIINADARILDEECLFVRDSRLVYGETLAAAKPLEGYDYMLLRIEARTERDDYLSFVEFAKLLQEAIKEGLRNKATGDSIIETARVAVYSSPDLTQADKARVARALWAEYESAVGAPTTAKADAAGTAVPLQEISKSLTKQITEGPSPEVVNQRLGLLDGSAVTLEDFLTATKRGGR